MRDTDVADQGTCVLGRTGLLPEPRREHRARRCLGLRSGGYPIFWNRDDRAVRASMI